MKTYTYRIIIEPDEKNTFHGFAPALPGCHTWGESVQETLENMHDAIKCHVRGLVKDNEPIPQEEGALESIQTFSEVELGLVDLVAA